MAQQSMKNEKIPSKAEVSHLLAKLLTLRPARDPRQSPSPPLVHERMHTEEISEAVLLMPRISPTPNTPLSKILEQLRPLKLDQQGNHPRAVRESKPHRLVTQPQTPSSDGHGMFFQLRASKIQQRRPTVVSPVSAIVQAEHYLPHEEDEQMQLKLMPERVSYEAVKPRAFCLNLPEQKSKRRRHLFPFIMRSCSRPRMATSPQQPPVKPKAPNPQDRSQFRKFLQQILEKGYQKHSRTDVRYQQPAPGSGYRLDGVLSPEGGERLDGAHHSSMYHDILKKEHSERKRPPPLTRKKMAYRLKSNARSTRNNEEHAQTTAHDHDSVAEWPRYAGDDAVADDDVAFFNSRSKINR